jgi:hypothetical protein
VSGGSSQQMIDSISIGKLFDAPSFWQIQKFLVLLRITLSVNDTLQLLLYSATKPYFHFLLSPEDTFHLRSFPSNDFRKSITLNFEWPHDFFWCWEIFPFFKCPPGCRAQKTSTVSPHIRMASIMRFSLIIQWQFGARLPRPQALHVYYVN